MKYFILILLLITRQGFSADTLKLSQLGKCMDALHGGGGQASEGPYSYVLSQDSSVGKGSLLVLTDKGAKLVDTTGDSTHGLVFVFTPSGQKTKMMQQVFLNEKGEITFGWSDPSTKDAPSKVRDISDDQAIKIAGAGALKRAEVKQENNDQDMKRFDEWVRSRYVSQQNGFSTEPLPNKAVNDERVAGKKIEINKELSSLASCDQVPDEAIKKAASLEKQRLNKIQEKIAGLDREAKAFRDCVAKASAKPGTKPQPAVK